jgi:hypothetical protein
MVSMETGASQHAHLNSQGIKFVVAPDRIPSKSGAQMLVHEDHQRQHPRLIDGQIEDDWEQVDRSVGQNSFLYDRSPP